MTTKPAHYLECIIPILDVASLDASVRFYEEKLGFAKDWSAEHDGESRYRAAGLSRDGQSLYLVESLDTPPRTSVWLGVENLRGVHAELLRRGAPITMAPRDLPWGRELRVEDPDGHVLRFCGDRG